MAYSPHWGCCHLLKGLLAMFLREMVEVMLVKGARISVRDR